MTQPFDPLRAAFERQGLKPPESTRPAAEPELELEAPLCIAQARTGCYDCGQIIEPIALVVAGVTDPSWDEDLQGPPPRPAILSYVTELPGELLGRMRAAHPPYRLHRTKTADLAYFTCWCDCGAAQGDFFLHRLDGPLAPLYSSEDLTVTCLQFDETVQARAQAGECTPGMVDAIASAQTSD